jgi:hypothetical protein
MINSSFVPFGGVCGWLADLTLSAKQWPQAPSSVASYYVAEPDLHRALAAIRTHAQVTKNAELVPRRALSKREVQRLGLTRGQVIAA